MLKEFRRVTRRWIIVQYFVETSLTRFKRVVKNALGQYAGVVHPLARVDMVAEIRASGLIEHGRFWCTLHYSEEVFLLLGKE